MQAAFTFQCFNGSFVLLQEKVGGTDLLWKSSTNRQATDEKSSQATEGMCKMAPAVNSGSIGSHRKTVSNNDKRQMKH